MPTKIYWIMSKKPFMFKRDYYSTFVMGFVGLVTGAFFLYISSVFYGEYANSFFLFPYPGIDIHFLSQEK